MRNFSMIGLSLCLIAALSVSTAATAECPENPSCDQMGECKSFETFRIPFETIRQCIEQGFDPPLRWRRLEGKGAINTGGVGSINFGALNSPYSPPSESGGGGSGSGGGGGGGGDSGGGDGGGDDPEVDCSDVISPRLLKSCDLRGEAVHFSDSPNTKCGAAIQLDHEWATLVTNPTHMMITNSGDQHIYIYRMSGANGLRFERRVEIPTFYCEIRQRVSSEDGSTETIAQKIEITPRTQLVQINERTEKVALKVTYAPENYGMYLEEGFLVLTRNGTLAFESPEPNPEYFSGQGAVKVDKDCYSADQLLSQELPDRFGEMLIGQDESDNCQRESLYMHNFMEDPAPCMSFVQDLNDGKANVIVPPGTAMASGILRGGKSYSQTTIRGATGSYRTGENGITFYNGPQLYVPGQTFYLSGTMREFQDRAFLGGATITLSDERILRLTPPGRIRLFRDHRMQLFDGGVVLNNDLQIIRQIAPNASVQFPPGKPIAGAITRNLAVDETVLLPTNGENIVRQPYDTRLDEACDGD